ncbi:MAG: PAS domain S-box protein [Acidobacteriota bacterium]
MEPSHLAPPSAPRASADGGALELIEVLAAMIQGPLEARSAMAAVERLRALPAHRRWRQLPGTYLLLEGYLEQLAPEAGGRTALRARVRRDFPGLLEEAGFGLVFEEGHRQEVLLCREFLSAVVGKVVVALGESAHPSIHAVGQWLGRLADPEDETVGELDGGSWGMLLARLGADLYDQLKASMGEEAVRRLYEETYDDVAEQYLGLSTFPAIIRLFPPNLLDETKIRHLSRSQTRKVLMDKLEELRGANRQLEENNADLQMALEVLERSNEQLEHRVEDRTRELRESEERFRLITSSAQDAILMVDPGGLVTYVNPAAERMFRAEPGHLQGRVLVDEVVPSRFRDRYRRAFRDAVRTGKGAIVGQAAEFVAQRRDGSEFPVELSMSAVRIGDAWNLVGMVRDISQRKREEEQRRQLEVQIQEAQRLESLGVLSGGLAHDFNNLLTTIIGNVGLMEVVLGSDFSMAENLRDVHEAAQRAADLTQQMLAYSGRGRFLVETLDVGAQVREMGELLRASVPKRWSLEEDFDPAAPCVDADRSQIQQVVMNLVSNAADSLDGPDGTVRVRVFGLEASPELLAECRLGTGLPAGLYTCLEVTDDGSGMDSDTWAKMFEPFFTTKFTGRGLGLSAVLGIVRGHRGALWVHSHPGQGTTVRVLLPASRSAPDAAADDGSGGTAVPVTGGTILVVDDEPAVRFLARSVLEAFGFDVLDAEDGVEAIEVYRERSHDIDLVLLDLTMPNMDGEQALGAIQGIDPEAKVLLCSGYSRDETMSRVAGRPVSGFIHKPYEVQALVSEVRRVLGGLPPMGPSTAG